jgi:hypothetical protein
MVVGTSEALIWRTGGPLFPACSCERTFVGFLGFKHLRVCELFLIDFWRERTRARGRFLLSTASVSSIRSSARLFFENRLSSPVPCGGKEGSSLSSSEDQEQEGGPGRILEWDVTQVATKGASRRVSLRHTRQTWSLAPSFSSFPMLFVCFLCFATAILCTHTHTHTHTLSLSLFSSKFHRQLQLASRKARIWLRSIASWFSLCSILTIGCKPRLLWTVLVSCSFFLSLWASLFWCSFSLSAELSLSATRSWILQGSMGAFAALLLLPAETLSLWQTYLMVGSLHSHSDTSEWCFFSFFLQVCVAEFSGWSFWATMQSWHWVLWCRDTKAGK